MKNNGRRRNEANMPIGPPSSTRQKDAGTKVVPAMRVQRN